MELYKDKLSDLLQYGILWRKAVKIATIWNFVE